MSNISKKEKVFVALSGGVDSSVAALLLQKEGYDVTGAHLICWEGCGAKEDRRDALRVAAKLGISFLTFDFRKEYREKVFEYMVSEYALGRTPNPDVACNREIKFGIFLEKALSAGADFIATGHYVRKIRNQSASRRTEIKILEAQDKNKDQSYFLWALGPEQIFKSLFPVGDYLKSEVREIARKAGLPTAAKKDSQGLCFVGQVDFRGFMRELLPAQEGLIKNSRGEILGKHDGAYFFTPGQRRGLRLGGFSRPLYVAQKNVDTNTLIVAEGEDDPALYRREIEVENLNLLRELPEKIEVRIRYRQPRQPARMVAQNSSGGKIRIQFAVPQRGVAAGQSAVFYTGEELLGGGIIK